MQGPPLGSRKKRSWGVPPGLERAAVADTFSPSEQPRRKSSKRTEEIFLNMTSSKKNFIEYINNHIVCQGA
jgi:hypothetical protein